MLQIGKNKTLIQNNTVSYDNNKTINNSQVLFKQNMHKQLT